MKKETEHSSGRKVAEKPRWDNWHVRLPNPKDQQRAIDLFQRSGAETKSDFVWKSHTNLTHPVKVF